MNSEQRKELVRRMWNAWVSGDMDTLCECVTDDVQWFAAGDFEHPKQGKAEIRDFSANSRRLFPQGQQAEFHRLFEADNCVIAETTTTGIAATGKHYLNHACIVFEIPHDKIERLRVYTDLTRVKAATEP
jgi:ketosteroid isomerase-like protein